VFEVDNRVSSRRKAPARPAVKEERLILPRPLRRIARFLGALVTGRVFIPRHTGTISTVVFFAAIGGYGMSLGGHANFVAQSATSAAGFAVEDLKVSGNIQTSEIEIFQQLDLDGSTSLISLDVEEVRQRLAKLPWVSDVEVQKVYPKTVEVRLKEREAFGIWQHGNDLSVIEASGSVIAPLRDNKFASLPLFVGRDAETAAAAFLGELKSWPEISNRVRAYVRIAGRRWDLHLDNGIVVKLPEDNLSKALYRLSRFDSEQQVLSRDVASVDLRLPDRTTVRLTEGAAERREAALAARAKVLKAAAGQRS
jgi:cell division protein FtsQ